MDTNPTQDPQQSQVPQSQDQQSTTPVTQPSQPSGDTSSSTPISAPVNTSAPASQTVDTEALKAEITNDVSGKIREEVSKNLMTKIAEGLGLSKKEEEKMPTDPKELQKYIDERADKRVEQVLTEREQAERQQYEEQRRQVSEGAQRFQSLWKTQYDQLAESGRVPRIINPNDRNDPGNVAKVKILTKLSQILKENQERGLDYVPTLKEVFYEFPDVLTNEIAGAHAPISGGGRTTTPNSGLTYEQMHSTSIEDLVKEHHNA